MGGLVTFHQAVSSWINHNVINIETRIRKKRGIFYIFTLAINAATSATDKALVISDDTSIRTKRGHHVGTTDEKKKNYEYVALAFKLGYLIYTKTKRR